MLRFFVDTCVAKRYGHWAMVLDTFTGTARPTNLERGEPADPVAVAPYPEHPDPAR